MRRKHIAGGCLILVVFPLGWILIAIWQFKVILAAQDRKDEERRAAGEQDIAVYKYDLSQNLCDELSSIVGNDHEPLDLKTLDLKTLLELLEIDTLDAELAALLSLSLEGQSVDCVNVRAVRNSAKENSRRTIRINTSSFELGFDETTKRLLWYDTKIKGDTRGSIELSADLVMARVVAILEAFHVLQCAELDSLSEQLRLYAGRYDLQIFHKELHSTRLFDLTIRADDGTVEEVEIRNLCPDNELKVLVTPALAEDIAGKAIVTENYFAPKIVDLQLALDVKRNSAHKSAEYYSPGLDEARRYVWAVRVTSEIPSILSLPWIYVKTIFGGFRQSLELVDTLVTVDVETGEILGNYDMSGSMFSPIRFGWTW